MLLSRLKLINYHQQSRFAGKYLYKMNNAYFRQVKDHDEYQLTFHYKNPDLKVDRAFNFCRKLDEPVDGLLNRIKMNVEKFVNKKNKKRVSQGETVSVLVSMCCNNRDVINETPCNAVFVSGNLVTLTILGTKFNVLINTPWIDNVCLPSSIMAQFPVYPSKFESVHTNLNLSDFHWFKTKDKTNFTHIGQGFSYTPTNEDIDSYLKISCVPKNENSEGPAIEVLSDCKVEAGPGICPFENRHAFTTTRLTGKEFRIVSYNILADLYCDSDYTREVLFPYCPPYALKIDYRKQLIRKELIGFNADILCLQEVDRKVYKHDLCPILSDLGYSSEFSVKGGEVVEGLALFYLQSRFKLLDNTRIVFAEILDKEPLFANIWEKIKTNDKLKERIMARTTTLQVNLLESLDNQELLVVGNTHLYFHPDADHIRLIHGGLAIKYLENYMEELKTKYVNKRISLIFCGDFNSVPECGIYKLYTTGQVPSDFIDYQSNKEETINNLELQQSIKLASACGTPKYTNFTAGFAACLDYIFYDQSNLEVVQVVPLPSDEELMQNTAIPSVTFPSDHVSLVADLKFL